MKIRYSIICVQVIVITFGIRMKWNKITESFRRFLMFYYYYIISINETDGISIDKNYKINKTVNILKDKGVYVCKTEIEKYVDNV